MIAGDVHLRCHLDRKFGNFLLQLLVPSDLHGSSRKTCKNDESLEELVERQLRGLYWNLAMCLVQIFVILAIGSLWGGVMLVRRFIWQFQGDRVTVAAGIRLSTWMV